MAQKSKAQEIQEVLDKDRDAINNSPFPEMLPPWLLDNFDEIIMAERQNVNRYSAKVMRSILSKKDNPARLTVYEGGLVLNILSAVQPFLIAKDIEEFLDKKQIIGELMFRYNMNMAKEEEKLKRKEASLINISRSRIVTE